MRLGGSFVEARFYFISARYFYNRRELILSRG